MLSPRRCASYRYPGEPAFPGVSERGASLCAAAPSGKSGAQSGVLGSRIPPPAGGGAGRSRGGSRKFRCGAVAAQGEPIIDGRLTTVLVDAADGTRVLSLIGDLVLATQSAGRAAAVWPRPRSLANAGRCLTEQVAKWQAARAAADPSRLWGRVVGRGPGRGL